MFPRFIYLFLFAIAYMRYSQASRNDNGLDPTRSSSNRIPYPPVAQQAAPEPTSSHSQKKRSGKFDERVIPPPMNPPELFWPNRFVNWDDSITKYDDSLDLHPKTSTEANQE
ncbi:hypothetical protein F53441_9349 [Fusarium austroafricanum]|uniref:Secreted protein n=1 Tax=Fusarium austroafricanum TaxID=2364996 RepID=A0A8H4KB65_9HYPO|nr:hypothetical protein F53441_9349 [Fusarium austroafricanum]